MRSIDFVVLATILMAAIPLSASVIDIPDDYPTIQQGIDVSSDGDTVLVQPGTYFENIIFNGHNIVVGSLYLVTGDDSYITLTLIAGNQAGTVVRFENGETEAATITGFTIFDGFSDDEHGGGGIYCANSSNPTIRHNDISSNLAWAPNSKGGGICCINSNPIIVDNQIRSNLAYGDPGMGGGIYCYQSSAIIDSNFINSNFADGPDGGFGGAIYCEYSSPSINGNAFAINIANNGSGGAIFAFESNPVLAYNTFYANSATEAGGILVASNSAPDISNSIFWNDAPSEIEVSGAEINVTYSDILGGWPGEGNIECDPQFCGADYLDFTLNYYSCCLENGRIGAFGAGCGIPCGDYVVGDFNGSGVFNIADIVCGFRWLILRGPGPAMICVCPPGSGNEWPVAGDLNASCAFDIADIVIGFSLLKTGYPNIEPCPDCPPGG